MTNKLKDDLLAQFRELLPELIEKAKSMKNFSTEIVSFPIQLRSPVIDEAVWSTKKQKFIKLILNFAAEDSEITAAEWLPENVVYTDKIIQITIDLEKNG